MSAAVMDKLEENVATDWVTDEWIGSKGGKERVM